MKHKIKLNTLGGSFCEQCKQWSSLPDGLIGSECSMDTTKITRVEVIDTTKDFENGGGRIFTFWDKEKKVELVLQDDNRTLKIIIK